MSFSRTADELASLVKCMDDRLRRLELLEDAVEPDSSPSRWSVKRKVATNQVLEIIGKIRDFMRGILLKETGVATRYLLLNLFDEHLVAHIHAVLGLVVDMLKNSHLHKDERLREARKACDSVIGVLREAGLGERLAKAMVLAKENLNVSVPDLVRQSSREIQLCTYMNTDRAEELHCFAKAPRMSFDRAKMLEDLDAAETDSEALHAIEMLFATYDADDSFALVGDAYDECVNDITRHLHSEAERVAERYGTTKLLPSDEVLKQWVIDIVDPNGDGAITFDEARQGFKAVVDDIETGDDYQRKRTSLTSESLLGICAPSPK